MKIARRIILGCVAVGFIVVGGCAAPAPKKLITELYEPMYTQQLSYQAAQVQNKPAGYTVGIINMMMDIETTPPNTWDFSSPLQQQYLKKFSESFSAGLEKIFTSKGINVSGPFEAYEEMTYPERSRCDFLVQPILTLNFQPTVGTYQKISEYWGPNGESFTYAKSDASLTVTAKMNYIIYDPLTKEKLERHKLKTDSVSQSSTLLAVRYTDWDKNGKVIKEWWVGLLEANPKHTNYYNGEILVGEITDKLYSLFMAKVDKIVSVEEFDHLKQYKEELKEKKRY